jgi:hypothetical protein
MCSGVYHALQVALLDHRIIGLVPINVQKLVWHEGDSLSVMQRTTFRTTRFYLRGLASLGVWRRLLRGRINVSGIARALAGRAIRHAATATDPAIAAVRGETQVGMVHRQLCELAERSVQDFDPRQEPANRMDKTSACLVAQTIWNPTSSGRRSRLAILRGLCLHG